MDSQQEAGQGEVAAAVPVAAVTTLVESEDSSGLEALTQSFHGAFHLDDQCPVQPKQAKRSHPSSDWGDKVSPLPKKVDIDDTPVYDRSGPLSPIPPPPADDFPTPHHILSPLLEDSPSKSFHLHRQHGKLLVVGAINAEHNTGPGHQECAQRTCLLLSPSGCLRRSEVSPHVHLVDAGAFPALPIADILRVHEYDYIRHLERRTELPHMYAPKTFLDIDTPLCKDSLCAAKRFCSAAMHAVDMVMGTQDEGFDRALVIGRPPGHHAGPHGCVVASNYWQRPGVASSGFCLLNNVAVAAAYARYKYGRDDPSKAPRIAIVDIDVHHGNGTEEIVRNLRPHEVSLPLPSSWAPLRKLSYKPWLNEKDPDEVFFASIHKFDGEGFYPGTGSEQANDPSENIVNLCLTPLPQRDAKKKGRRLEDLMKLASDEFRAKVSSILIPRMQAFKPDLIFISAGFDAHYDDMYHYLSEDDIHWVTAQLCQVNDDAGGNGVISVLEGGYSLSTELHAAPSSPVGVVAPVVTTGGMSLRGKGAAKSSASAAPHPPVPPTAPVTKHDKFAIRTGDGGLVKGVLAHAAALAKRKEWQAV